VPYRIDVLDPPDHALDTLVALGALDVEPVTGGLAALLPDTVSAEYVAHVLGLPEMRVSLAAGRDDASVWTLSPRPVRIRTLSIVPADGPTMPGALRLVEGAAFGTGLHPTTALCLEAIEDRLDTEIPDRMLDVGTGSGVLALAALRRGTRRAAALDVDDDALSVAARNGRLNGTGDRLWLVQGGPDAIRGWWPLVVANIRAAELMELAPSITSRVASRGRLVLSGIPRSVAPDVERAYCRLGMNTVSVAGRDGWAALVLHPTRS
jgi:ribosomal protein L11 methyltransferase